ncbi:MAG: hypothetical protein QF408_04675 [Pirellulales bacterium]|nr:hypothetical protein [Pirellulales bacterium]
MSLRCIQHPNWPRVPQTSTPGEEKVRKQVFFTGRASIPVPLGKRVDLAEMPLRRLTEEDGLPLELEFGDGI